MRTKQQPSASLLAVSETSWAFYCGTMRAPTLFSSTPIDSSLLFKSSPCEKTLCLKCRTWVGRSCFAWNLRCYCIQWKNESGHQSERERLKCKVIFTLWIMAHIFSRCLSLSPLDGFIVLQKMMKSRDKNERGATAEKQYPGYWRINLWSEFGWKWGGSDCAGCPDLDEMHIMSCSPWPLLLLLFLCLRLSRQHFSFMTFRINLPLLQKYDLDSSWIHLHTSTYQSGEELETFHRKVRFISSFGHLIFVFVVVVVIISKLRELTASVSLVWSDVLLLLAELRESLYFSTGPFLINWSLLKP